VTVSSIAVTVTISMYGSELVVKISSPSAPFMPPIAVNLKSWPFKSPCSCSLPFSSESQVRSPERILMLSCRYPRVTFLIPMGWIIKILRRKSSFPGFPSAIFFEVGSVIQMLGFFSRAAAPRFGSAFMSSLSSSIVGLESALKIIILTGPSSRSLNLSSVVFPKSKGGKKPSIQGSGFGSGSGSGMGINLLVESDKVSLVLIMNL